MILYDSKIEWYVTEGQEIEEFDELVEVQSDKERHELLTIFLLIDLCFINFTMKHLKNR